MTSGSRSPVTTADLLAAVTGAGATFEGLVDRDWSQPARDLDMSCLDTLAHIHQAMWFYAGQTATGGTERQPFMTPRPPSGVESAIECLPTSAAILQTTVGQMGPGARAWHGAGMADAEGFLAMGCDEIMVHTWDIAEALGGGYTPPADIAGKVVDRLFPWAPAGGDPAATLLWCNGRIALGGHERLSDDWDWQCAPLSEWSGRPNTRSNRGAR